MSIHRQLLGLGVVAATIGLVGCATKPPLQQSTPPRQSSVVNSTPSTVTSSIIPGSAQDFRVNVGDTVHFAYNAYQIENNDKQLLQRQAQWLNRYPAVRVTIEGHCDERGTREYNLALGARRANEVKEYLVGAGVTGERIQSVSYGKERPICTDSNEGCWAQNRRAVTTITNGATA